MSEALAYAAGILDGEGSVSVNLRANGTVVFQAAVYNSDKRLIDWFVAQFGGHVSVRAARLNPEPGIKSRREGRVWYLRNRAVVPFLREVEPYLVIKRRQAEIIFALNETIGHHGGRGPIRFLPADVLAKRRALVTELKALHL